MAADEVKRVRTNADWLRSINEYELICGIVDRLARGCGVGCVCPLEIIFDMTDTDCTVGNECKECLRKWLYKEHKEHK